MGPLLSSGPTAVLRPSGTRRSGGLTLLCFIALAICGCGGPIVERPGDGLAPAEQPAPPGLDAARTRAVTITTTACGFAPGTEGSGLALSTRQVLTAAHVVAGATDIEVTSSAGTAGSAKAPATVVAYDTSRDLAIVEVGPGRLDLPEDGPRFRSLDAGQEGLVVGAARSGDVAFVVTERTTIEIDEVRGSERVRRAGYLLAATTGPGDSGSGLYDLDGYLVGLLFAVSTDDQRRSWATRAEEIEDFLADRTVAGRFACDADRSRLTAR